MRTIEILRKIIVGEYCAKDVLGTYLLTKQDIKEALDSGMEVIIEDRSGDVLGYLFLGEDGIGFVPRTSSYIES